jgi:hypothetical protein
MLDLVQFATSASVVIAAPGPELILCAVPPVPVVVVIVPPIGGLIGRRSTPVGRSVALFVG